MKSVFVVILMGLAGCSATPEQINAVVNTPDSFGCLKAGFHGSYTNTNIQGGRLRVPDKFYSQAQSMTPEQVESFVRGLVSVLCP